MRIIRLTPWQFQTDTLIHESNFIEISKTSDFTDIEYSETSDDLNFYKLNMEPSAEQSLWIRVSRNIRDTSTNELNRTRPTQELEIVYNNDTAGRIDCTFIDKPTLYLNSSANIMKGTQLLSDYLVDGKLTIDFGKVISDNNWVSKTNLVIKTNKGEVLYHRISASETSFTIDLSNEIFDEYVVISGSVENTSGAQSKTTSLRLGTSPTLLFESFNLFPLASPEADAMFKINNLGYYDFRISLLDEQGSVVLSTTGLNTLIIPKGYLEAYSNYVIKVSALGDTAKRTEFLPIAIRTDKEYFNNFYNTQEELLNTKYEELHITNNLVDIPDSASFHTDEMNGLYIGFKNNKLTINSLVFNINTTASTFVTILSNNLIVSGRHIVKSNEITSFNAYGMDDGHFMIDVYGTFGRRVAIYKYDVNLNVLKYIKGIYSTTNQVVKHVGSTVLSNTVSVSLRNYQDKYWIRVITLNEDTGIYGTKEISLGAGHNKVMLLHNDGVNIVLSLDDKRVSFNTSTDEQHIVAGPADEFLLHKQSVKNLQMTKEKLLAFLPKDILLNTGGETTEYMVGMVNNPYRIIRKQNLKFMTYDISLNRWYMHGTSNDPAPYVITLDPVQINP